MTYLRLDPGLWVELGDRAYLILVGWWWIESEDAIHMLGEF